MQSLDQTSRSRDEEMKLHVDRLDENQTTLEENATSQQVEIDGLQVAVKTEHSVVQTVASIKENVEGLQAQLDELDDSVVTTVTSMKEDAVSIRALVDRLVKRVDTQELDTHDRLQQFDARTAVAREVEPHSKNSMEVVEKQLTQIKYEVQRLDQSSKSRIDQVKEKVDLLEENQLTVEEFSDFANDVATQIADIQRRVPPTDEQSRQSIQASDPPFPSPAESVPAAKPKAKGRKAMGH